MYLIGSLEMQREHKKDRVLVILLNSLYLSSWHNQDCFGKTIDNTEISKEHTSSYWDYEIMDYDNVYLGKIVTLFDKTLLLSSSR